MRAKLRRGEKILIHSAAGGVGLACLHLAFGMGCEVFATVGSQEKKNQLLKSFPGLKSDHIMDSRANNFEHEVKALTNGEGVDVVVNSLAKEKLFASVRTLAMHGRFLECGKVDMADNSDLAMACFLKDISFHGILLDSMTPEEWNAEGGQKWHELRTLMTDGLKSGVVKPLNHVIYEKERIVDAFRHMATGTHYGKVLVEMNKEADTKLPTIEAMPRFYCDPYKTYLLVGGLGGFGLEVAQWLAARGATKLVLTSRSGVTNGYQGKAITRMREHGVDVRISKKNCIHYSQAKELIQECMAIAPLAGVFNLAMVLKDTLFENMTEEIFKMVLEPKVKGTLNLDSVTRELCGASLEHFCIFSSMWGGRGNPGQSNYGYSNAAMERICEERKAAGLSALAIQWGGIGDVGVVIETLGDNEFVIRGSLPQRMPSCLTVLDTFLSQTDSTVIASSVVASKQLEVKIDAEMDLIATLFKLLGITDLSTVAKDASLGSLGLDSLTAAEIRQVMERHYNLHMSMKEIRALTMNSLRELETSLAENKS